MPRAGTVSSMLGSMVSIFASKQKTISVFLFFCNSSMVLTRRSASARGDLGSVKSFSIVHLGVFLATTLVTTFRLAGLDGEVTMTGLGLFELRADRRAMLANSVPVAGDSRLMLSSEVSGWLGEFSLDRPTSSYSGPNNGGGGEERSDVDTA